MARDLGNLPANLCTPTILANEAEAMARPTDSSARYWAKRRSLKKLTAWSSFLAVAQGSREPPRFIILEHAGGPKRC